MSSAATITWPEDEIGVSLQEWQVFCERHQIEYSPMTVGGNVYYAGADKVECVFGAGSFGPDAPAVPRRPPSQAHRVSFSVTWMGEGLDQVARLARALWVEYGGQLHADPEIRRRFAQSTVMPR